MSNKHNGQSRNLSLFFVALFLIHNLLPGIALAQGNSTNNFTPPTVTAKTAILMDAETGRVIWGRNINQRRPQASTTKITTAILALEYGQLDKKVTISDYAAITGESSIWLEKGEVLTLKQLIDAALIQSANDACVAIAETVAGSEEKFVQSMNDLAKNLGAKNTHYANPHGLHHPKHYSSAFDLATLARYGLKQVPGFQEVVKTWRATIPWAGHPWERVLYNHNKLLKRYPGADGVKTGFTNQAGKCLVSSATRNGHQLIAVVMDSADMYTDSANLLNYGYKNFSLENIQKGNEYLKTVMVEDGEEASVEVYTGKELKYPLTKQEKARLSKEVILKDSIKAPIKAGQQVGEIIYKVGNQVIVKEPLVVKATIPQKSFLTKVREFLQKAIMVIAID